MECTLREPLTATSPMLESEARVAWNAFHCSIVDPLTATSIGLADIQHEGWTYCTRGAGAYTGVGAGAATEIVRGAPGMIFWKKLPNPGNACSYHGFSSVIVISS